MVKEVKTVSEVTESFEQSHSVKFAINSYGRWSAEVKVYGKTPQEALQDCLRLTKDVEAILSEKNKNLQNKGFKEVWNEVKNKE